MRFWRRKPAERAIEESEAALAESAEDAAIENAFVAVEEEPAEEELVIDFTFTEEEVAEVQEQTDRAVERTRRGFFGRLGSMFERSDFTDELWDDLEETLIGSDSGLQTTQDIVSAVREEVRRNGVKQSAEVREILRDELIAILEEPRGVAPRWEAADAPVPLVMLVVGVNGAGKTTSIAKMAHAFKRDGATVVLGAADTFRAAAIDQLRIWGERVGVRVVGHQPGADPGAVAFDTLTAAESVKAEIVIIDTAGRLHTKSNLMEELKKIARVVQRKYPEAPHETLLVLDATTGQNGLMQARTFTETAGVTGIVLAKLDGTAKGGIAFAIAHELGIPVRFIGTGEKLDDLAPFDARTFVDSLLA